MLAIRTTTAAGAATVLLSSLALLGPVASASGAAAAGALPSAAQTSRVSSQAGPRAGSVSDGLRIPPGFHGMIGTRGVDRLHGTHHSDLLGGRGGNDVLRPDFGADIVRGGPGDDKIYLFNDGVRDRIHCGDGFDVVAYHYSVDQRDVLDPNCEVTIA